MNNTKVSMRIPENFSEYHETIMSNCDNIINDNVANAIKGKNLCSQYAGWNFCGYVWYQNSQWYCEVWVYKSWVETFNADTLEEIMTDVSDEYGYE